MDELLFVYGSLRRRGGADLEGLVPASSYVGEAELPGLLYLVAEFPGLKEVSGEKPLVVGEVYRIRPEDWAFLDDYEDFRPAAPLEGIYRRELRIVRMKDRSRVRAWVYLYNRSVEGFPLIESGDFVRFLLESPPDSLE